MDFTSAYTAFGEANLSPWTSYADGTGYPWPQVGSRITLTGSRPGTGTRKVWTDHLSTAPVTLRPDRTLRGTRTLRVRLDMPTTSHGFTATLLVHRRDGSTARRPVRLSNTGAGSARVDFTRSRVASVVLLMVNASTRLDCGHGTVLSCHGLARDDDAPVLFNATAVRG
ncbi:hypothetical protein [Nocardioides mesophilus]|uniref:Uncharacterized protein n=1 Tax=Nocardioides mesophilus TaxID=433659 RepID=A0A7G9R9K2_9ACTN|nr:hypothetical protein [Nocardioides mesophilus]QNN52277.1 hypothetical protein H9L09_17595 [Nocardioides mesophilus]